MNKNFTHDFILITAGTIIVSAAIYFFLIPSGIPLGSISGLAMVLSHFLPLSVSALTFLLNLFLLVIGFLFIGREFGAKTVYTSVLLPLVMAVLEMIFPYQQSIMRSDVLDSVCFMFISNIGLALLFLCQASSGGLDIAAKLLNRFLRVDLGTALSLAGLVVSLSSIMVADMRTVIWALLFTYLNGLILDHFIFGMDLKRKVCVISKKAEDIRAFILCELHSGATMYHAIGAYNKEPHCELVTIVDKSEYIKLMQFLEATDPSAFITVYSISAISYRPKP